MQLQGGVSVVLLVGLLIVGAVVHPECQVVEEVQGKVGLVLGHLHYRRIGQRKTCVALPVMVVEHHIFHHPSLVVAASDPEDISLDSIVECSGRDLDLFLGLADVIPQREDLVVGDRYKVVDDEESADADEERGDENRQHHPENRHSGRFQGDELVVLAHIPDGHHRGEQCGQRQRQRQHGAASPEEELRHDAEAQTLTDQLVDVNPQELHHKDEDDHKQDHKEWSYE